LPKKKRKKNDMNLILSTTIVEC